MFRCPRFWAERRGLLVDGEGKLSQLPRHRRSRADRIACGLPDPRSPGRMRSAPLRRWVMNGAESLVRTLGGGGVSVCFANPGTSEMHFVAALDRVDGMRCVFGLFEGVVTGAADGYYRMSDGPAATLLHLGPGMANGLANIHNANKALSGMVNIVGD